MFQIRAMTGPDWPDVERIFAAGIEGGNATFETSTPDWLSFNATRLVNHRWVAESDDGALLGWAAVVPVSARGAYAGVVENSVYVAPEAQGQGVGRALLEKLIESTEAAGIWTLYSSVFPENTVSLALHESLGFRQIGVRERVAKNRGTWRDTVLIERRSRVAGVG
ncbi:GNAT family N-acetyltransferase [Arthrobacter sp. H5]|uniref:GNAT family N-acetyltransferase n=1 Tax=Arthrobacter sp. H5 TaxID=1267973 RepID=UPI0004835179|nr:GNAT family N-acetyltransferase [Arthrobacter sp. H5]